MIHSISPIIFAAASGPSPTTISAMNHYVIDTSGGGQRLVFTVADSTGCTSLQISGGGPAGTAFAIDDATHVSCLAPAHAAGAVSWTVTNGGGPSAPFAGSQYWNPSVLTAFAWWRADLGATTVVSGALPSDLTTWSLDGTTTRVAGQSDPLGGTSACKFVEGTDTATHSFYSYPIDHVSDVNGFLTYTIYAKSNGRDWFALHNGTTFRIWLNATTGAIGSTDLLTGDAPVATSQNMGGGWWKFTITKSGDGLRPWSYAYVRLYMANADASASYTGDGASGLYFYAPTQQAVAVSALADQSGSGDSARNATQGTAAKYPAMILADPHFGGQPCVSFDHSDTRLVTGVFSASLGANFTFASVARVRTANANGRILSGGNGIDSWNDGSSLRAQNTSWQYIVCKMVTMSTMHAQIVCARSAANCSGYTDSNTNNEITPTNDNGVTTPGTLHLGNYYGGSAYWGWDEAEIVLVDRVISGAEVATLNAYFAQRYGLTIAA